MVTYLTVNLSQELEKRNKERKKERKREEIIFFKNGVSTRNCQPGCWSTYLTYLISLNFIVGGHKNVRLSPEDANSFGGKVRRSALHKLFGINIYHECYVEGCSFEEVNEVDEIPSKQKKVSILKFNSFLDIML